MALLPAHKGAHIPGLVVPLVQKNPLGITYVMRRLSHVIFVGFHKSHHCSLPALYGVSRVEAH